MRHSSRPPSDCDIAHSAPASTKNPLSFAPPREHLANDLFHNAADHEPPGCSPVNPVRPAVRLCIRSNLASRYIHPWVHPAFSPQSSAQGLQSTRVKTFVDAIRKRRLARLRVCFVLHFWVHHRRFGGEIVIYTRASVFCPGTSRCSRRPQ